MTCLRRLARIVAALAARLSADGPAQGQQAYDVLVYGDAQWGFEPGVAEAVFVDWLAEHEVEVVDARLDRDEGSNVAGNDGSTQFLRSQEASPFAANKTGFRITGWWNDVPSYGGKSLKTAVAAVYQPTLDQVRFFVFV